MKSTLWEAIQDEKKKLTAKAAKSGIYENFGQKEVEKIRKQFVNDADRSFNMNVTRRAVNQFDEWCMNYSL